METVQMEERQIRKIDESSMKERAAIFAHLYDKEDIEFVMLHLARVGLDAGYLAYIAITEHKADLLKHALDMEANLDCNSVDGKTLFQHVVASQDHDLIQVVLAEDDHHAVSFNITCMNAIKDGDLATINALLAYDSDIIFRTFHGYTLLQHAISHNRLEIFESIIQADSRAIYVLDDEQNNAFKTILLSDIANPEILGQLLPHMNMQQECDRLVHNKEMKLLEKAVSLGFIDATFIEESLKAEAAANPLDLGNILQHQDGDLSTIGDVHNHNDTTDLI